MACAQCGVMNASSFTARRAPIKSQPQQQSHLARLRSRGGRSPAQHRMPACRPLAALQIDWSDPDTLVGLAGAVLGIGIGIGAPAFYISRDMADEKRLEELRELNRETFKETGEYMTEEEIKKFRTPRWTDRREFQDDD